MSNQTNIVILQCGVTQDPVKKQAGEYTVATFSVANSRGFGQKVKTHYFNVEAWGKTAETILNYVRKGTQLNIEGELKYEAFEDQQGNKRSAVKIVCRSFSFTLGNKKLEGDEPEENKQPAKQVEALPFNDDDIPF